MKPRRISSGQPDFWPGYEMRPPAQNTGYISHWSLRSVYFAPYQTYNYQKAAADIDQFFKYTLQSSDRCA